MAIKHLSAKLAKAVQGFSSADGGNLAMMFALAVVPIMGLVGAAVDYSRANSDKAAMQAAVDATALMLSKNVSTLTTAQISQEATNYFNALFTRSEVTNVVLTPTYTNNNGSQVVITATGTLATKFMKIMGYQNLNINVASTVKWGNQRLRVALVLDNTGSMADNNKIGALQTATNNLLTQLKNAVVNNGDVYVSIIPFVKDVNVDPVNYNALWIDWTDWDASNGKCSSSKYSDKSHLHSRRARFGRRTITIPGMAAWSTAAPPTPQAH